MVPASSPAGGELLANTDWPCKLVHGGLHLAVLTPPRRPAFSLLFLVAALTLVCDVQPVPPCVRHVFRDCVNR